jgi:hypothetical protein
MSSFTSSSSLARLVRILASMAGCIAVYQGIISLGWVPASKGIHQMEDNIIRAEHYLHSAQQTDILLLGSSYTVWLPAEELGQNAVNLALAGGTAATGLSILERMKGKPREVWVEMSHALIRPEDTELLAALFGPEQSLREHCSAMQRRYQPVSVLATAYTQWEESRRPPAKPVSEKTQLLRQQRHEAALTSVARTFADPLPTPIRDRLRATAEALLPRLQRLKESGVRVILFRTPVCSQAEAGRYLPEVDALYASLFPPQQWHWILPPAGRSWDTTDGLHLGPIQGRAYAQYLKSQSK